MTVQEALRIARGVEAFARPNYESNYVYRYQTHGKLNLIHVLGRDRFGVLKSDFWRTMSQKEIESEWTVCNRNGEEIDPRKPLGPTLQDLVA